jgi:hypothetical protein
MQDRSERCGDMTRPEREGFELSIPLEAVYRISRSGERGAGRGTGGHRVFRIPARRARLGRGGHPRWDSVEAPIRSSRRREKNLTTARFGSIREFRKASSEAHDAVTATTITATPAQPAAAFQVAERCDPALASPIVRAFSCLLTPVVTARGVRVVRCPLGRSTPA